MNGMLIGVCLGVIFSIAVATCIAGFATLSMWFKPNPFGILLGIGMTICVGVAVVGFFVVPTINR